MERSDARTCVSDAPVEASEDAAGTSAVAGPETCSP